MPPLLYVFVLDLRYFLKYVIRESQVTCVLYRIKSCVCVCVSWKYKNLQIFVTSFINPVCGNYTVL